MSASHVVTPADASKRLDVYVSEFVPGLTRSAAQRLIAKGLVTVDGQSERNSYRLRAGQRVAVTLPEVKATELVAEAVPLTVVYEDCDIIVIDKPAGMVVHPAVGHRRGTLVNALLHHVQDLAGISGEERPGIVHRLDKNTSGLLVVAKHTESLLRLQQQLASRRMGREYVALTHGCPKVWQGTVNAPIGRHPARRKEMAVVPQGRAAVTHYQVLDCLGGYALLACRLETGRTHQIRVHLAYLGHPIVGDEVYGPRKSPLQLTRHMLHAAKLTLTHPLTGERMEFGSELPAEFRSLLDKLQRMAGGISSER
jgi:23S rRNA pseudouridine1911/1915/1917 synthase